MTEGRATKEAAAELLRMARGQLISAEISHDLDIGRSGDRAALLFACYPVPMRALLLVGVAMLAILVWVGGALALMLWAIPWCSAPCSTAPHSTGSVIVQPIHTAIPTDERRTTSEPTTGTRARAR